MAEQHFMRPLMTAQLDLVREAENNPAKRDEYLQGVQDLTFFLHCWVYEACEGTVYAIYHESDTEAKHWPAAFKDITVNVWPLPNKRSISWKCVGLPPPRQGAAVPPLLPVAMLKPEHRAQVPLATLQQPGARQTQVPAPQFPNVPVEMVQGMVVEWNSMSNEAYFQNYRARRALEIAAQCRAEYFARQNARMQVRPDAAVRQPAGGFQQYPAMNNSSGQLQSTPQGQAAQAVAAFPYPLPQLVGGANRAMRYQQADARRRAERERELARLDAEEALLHNSQM